MSLSYTIQRSRPLQSLLAIFAFVLLYGIFYTEWFSSIFSSSSTYTPEEINSLLQNKASQIVALKSGIGATKNSTAIFG